MCVCVFLSGECVCVCSVSACVCVSVCLNYVCECMNERETRTYVFLGTGLVLTCFYPLCIVFCTPIAHRFWRGVCKFAHRSKGGCANLHTDSTVRPSNCAFAHRLHTGFGRGCANLHTGFEGGGCNLHSGQNNRNM